MKEQPDLLRLDGSGRPVTLARVLAPERVVILEAQSKREALSELVSTLATAPEIGDSEELATAIVAREDLMSTGIGLHVGVPHVRLASISDIVMAVGLAPHGLPDYESIDGLPVYLVFAIAANVSQHKEYIQLLARVSHLVKDATRRQQLLSAQTADDLYAGIMIDEDI
jgi:PTS system nitrogen regulatory IIA component